jgi:hypothetical protein
MGKECLPRLEGALRAPNPSLPLASSVTTSQIGEPGHHHGSAELVKGRLIPRPSLILTELINQFPNIATIEAFDLALEVDKQLAGLSEKSISNIRFRRTHLQDPPTAVWITILDYVCRASADKVRNLENVLTHDQFKLYKGVVIICQLGPTLEGGHALTLHSTILTLDTRSQPTTIQEWDSLSDTLRLLGGHDHLSTLSKQLKIVHSGGDWKDPNIPSGNYKDNELILGQIRRICAWGVVATGTRRANYRVFAACVQGFCVAPAVPHLDESNLDCLQNLSLNIVPLIRFTEVEYGMIYRTLQLLMVSDRVSDASATVELFKAVEDASGFKPSRTRAVRQDSHSIAKI